MQSDDALAKTLLGPLLTALEPYTAPQPVPEAVVDGLNNLVNGSSIYDGGLFAASSLSLDIIAAANNPSLFDGGLKALTGPS